MDKKSFILYLDYKKNISALTQSEKGDLLDAIFDFHEGEEPELQGVVGMAFSFIKTDLEMNAKKWEEAKNKKSFSGRLGNMSKWHPELYKKIKKQQISLEEAEEIANDRKGSQTIADDRKASQTIAKDRKVSQCDKTQKIEKQFNEFWEVYNFKHNKEQSRKAFANALKIIKFDDLIEAVKKYNSVRKEGFIFKPNNWLNGKHWDDEYQNNPPQEEEQADKEEFYKAWVNCYCTKPAYKDSKIFKDFVQECKAEMTAKTFEAWFQLNLMDVKSDSIIFETEKEFIIDALMGENNHCMNGKAKDIIFKVTKKHFGNKNLVFQYMKNGIFLQKEYKLN